jgi:hypothetical protein
MPLGQKFIKHDEYLGGSLEGHEGDAPGKIFIIILRL